MQKQKVGKNLRIFRKKMNDLVEKSKQTNVFQVKKSGQTEAFRVKKSKQTNIFQVKKSGQTKIFFKRPSHHVMFCRSKRCIFANIKKE